MPPRSNPHSDRAAVAIVSNSQTPYRLHVHRRIARELPGIKLWSLFTHETGTSAWRVETPPEIGPVLFGTGESCQSQGRPAGALKEWRRGGEIIQWIREHDVRFVLVIAYNDLGRMRLLRWCRGHGIPCFLFGDSNIHGDLSTGLKAWLKKRVVGWVARTAAGILTCGSLGRAYFEKYGGRPERIFYFPYEPDYALIQDLRPEQITRARDRFSLDPARRRIVYSGRLAAQKRVDLLLDVFTRVAPQRPDWDLVIVGDGPLQESLAARVSADVARRVVWTGFLDDQEAVSAVYRNCDVLALPSDYEPWGLVVNEAVAARLAVVASTVVGAAAELVKDGVNGRLFPPGDAKRLEECLLDVTDAGRIDAMKAASAGVLAEWRRRADPIEGLRQALRAAGIAGGDARDIGGAEPLRGQAYSRPETRS